MILSHYLNYVIVFNNLICWGRLFHVFAAATLKALAPLCSFLLTMPIFGRSQNKCEFIVFGLVDSQDVGYFLDRKDAWTSMTRWQSSFIILIYAAPIPRMYIVRCRSMDRNQTYCTTIVTSSPLKLLKVLHWKFFKLVNMS